MPDARAWCSKRRRLRRRNLKRQEHPIAQPNPHAKAGLAIGLLGGSFNPAHAGHRAMSLYALKRLKLDEIWWLVSPQNPLKSVQGMGSLATRVQKAALIARHPRIRVTPIEAELGTIYTADTLTALKKLYPNARFVWLMGADNMRQVTRWRRWPDIFTTVPVAVFRRPAYAAGRGCGKPAQRFDAAWLPISEGKNLVNHKAPAWMMLDNPLNGISATMIRKDQTTWPK